jgi:AcrR family transcriptional regulator
MFKTSAHRAEPQRGGSEATRQQILETALTLFREKGFDATTIRDIASAAGISLGAAYYYFKSKEAIVGAYYDYVQHEHLERARQAYAGKGDLRARLRAAFHTKIDIMQEDRGLLRALFRYGGDPDHSLSWFGPATQHQRELSASVFAQAIEGERFPDDVRQAGPTLLWTLHMGILLFFLYDSSPHQRRTRKLIDAATDFVVDTRRVVTSPLLRPVRRRVFGILRDAGLLTATADV